MKKDILDDTIPTLKEGVRVPADSMTQMRELFFLINEEIKNYCVANPKTYVVSVYEALLGSLVNMCFLYPESVKLEGVHEGVNTKYMAIEAERLAEENGLSGFRITPPEINNINKN